MTPLFKRILGPSYGVMPAAVQELHDVSQIVSYTGVCQATRGPHPVARGLAALMRLPPAGHDMPVTVLLQPIRDGERWKRQFGRHRFRSTLRQRSGYLSERIGPVTFVFELIASPDMLIYELRDLKVLGVPCGWLMRAKVRAVESVQTDGAFRFAIDASLPWLGRIVAYQGWLRRHD